MNLPINETTAVRLVGWYEHSPGYIDNVKGSMTFPTSGITMTNYESGHNYAEDNYNDGDTYGARALLKIDLNDEWSITPGVMGQVSDYNGLNSYDPNIGDLKLTHFFKETAKDTWVQASLTVQGKIGNWDMVYAGAYLDRNDEVRSDYSDYAYWYDVCCGYGTSMVNNDGDFINPAQYIKGKDGYEMWSNELRFSSPRDKRLRFTGGFFAQQASHQHRAALPGRRPGHGHLGHRLAGHDLADRADAYRRQLRAVRRVLLRHHRQADRHRRLSRVQDRQQPEGLLRFQPELQSETGESQCQPCPATR